MKIEEHDGVTRLQLDPPEQFAFAEPNRPVIGEQHYYSTDVGQRRQTHIQHRQEDDPPPMVPHRITDVLADADGFRLAGVQLPKTADEPIRKAVLPAKHTNVGVLPPHLRVPVADTVRRHRGLSR